MRLLLLFLLLAGSSAHAGQSEVLFVCEHGVAKSAMAALIFEHAARARGLEFVGVSRGVQVTDTTMPASIAAGLRAEGIDPSGFAAQPLRSSDYAPATVIVTLGVDVPTARGVEAWNDIPPAAQDYAAASAALHARIERLLDALETRVMPSAALPER